MEELLKIAKQIEEIHFLVKKIARKRENLGEELSYEQVAERSGLSVNTIRQYTSRGKIKSRKRQPGAKGSKRYFLEAEVFDLDGSLIIHEV